MVVIVIRYKKISADVSWVSAKYSCGFSNSLDSSIIVNER